MYRIGIDLGGTKIEGVALSPTGGELRRMRVATPRGSYDATLDAIVGLIDAVSANLDGAPVAGVGVGIPGSISAHTGYVRNANSTCLNGKEFHADLQSRLNVPLSVENDANCFALSEAADGAAQGYATVFGVILGTGVGGGLIVNGKPLTGRNNIAGEWGHNPLPWPDAGDIALPCYCGRKGCIETYLSGPALECQYRELSGQSAGAKLIAERASKGDRESVAALSLYALRLAKSLAAVINIVDPDVIVFGGGVSNIPSILKKTRDDLPAFVFSDRCDTEFKVNRWGDSSGVRGAARLI